MLLVLICRNVSVFVLIDNEIVNRFFEKVYHFFEIFFETCIVAVLVISDEPAGDIISAVSEMNFGINAVRFGGYFFD